MLLKTHLDCFGRDPEFSIIIVQSINDIAKCRKEERRGKRLDSEGKEGTMRL